MHCLVQKSDEFQSCIFNFRPKKVVVYFFYMIFYYIYMNIPVYTLFGNCCIWFQSCVYAAYWRFQYLKGL